MRVSINTCLCVFICVCVLVCAQITAQRTYKHAGLKSTRVDKQIPTLTNTPARTHASQPATVKFNGHRDYMANYYLRTHASLPETVKVPSAYETYILHPTPHTLHPTPSTRLYRKCEGAICARIHTCVYVCVYIYTYIYIYR
jgi:hypothetical protein